MFRTYLNFPTSPSSIQTASVLSITTSRLSDGPYYLIKKTRNLREMSNRKKRSQRYGLDERELTLMKRTGKYSVPSKSIQVEPFKMTFLLWTITL